MKTTIFFLLISLNLTSQTFSLKKTWIDEENNGLVISDSSLWIQGINFTNEYGYIYKNDTLIFIEYLFTNPKKYPRIENKYKIVLLNNDSLILAYPRKFLGEYTKEIDTLVYIDSTKVISKLDSFKLLQFQGTYPSSLKVRTTLEIDNLGNVHCIEKGDSTNVKWLKLNVLDIHRLHYLFKRARLENLNEKNIGISIDGRATYLNLFGTNYSYKKKLSSLPYLDWNLFDFIRNIRKAIKKYGELHNDYEFKN